VRYESLQFQPSECKCLFSSHVFERSCSIDGRRGRCWNSSRRRQWSVGRCQWRCESSVWFSFRSFWKSVWSPNSVHCDGQCHDVRIDVSVCFVRLLSGLVVICGQFYRHQCGNDMCNCTLFCHYSGLRLPCSVWCCFWIHGTYDHARERFWCRSHGADCCTTCISVRKLLYSRMRYPRRGRGIGNDCNCIFCEGKALCSSATGKRRRNIVLETSVGVYQVHCG
jgi:hypothetical protein